MKGPSKLGFSFHVTAGEVAGSRRILEPMKDEQKVVLLRRVTREYLRPVHISPIIASDSTRMVRKGALEYARQAFALIRGAEGARTSTIRIVCSA